MSRAISHQALIFGLFVFLSHASLGLGAARKAGGPIPRGKWVGYLQTEGSPDAFALTMDSFIVQPDDIQASPHLALSFKIGLGGYGGSEYDTELFTDPKYDYEQGLLTLDDPYNELVITAYVTTNPLEMKGQVYLRSAATTARLYLKFLTDEPDDKGFTNRVKEVVPPFAPALAGQYVGLCGTESAVLQIETAKGVADPGSTPAAGLAHFSITGALGVVNGLCPTVNGANRPAWCVDHAYSSGIYAMFQGRIQLSGGLETDTCTRVGGELTCGVKLVPKNAGAGGLVDAVCKLKKEPTAPLPFQSFPRKYAVEATAAQMEPMPPLSPPASSATVAAANGPFFGYLHHDGLDRYQPLRLNVMATTSTDNPHNENNVFVSVGAVLYFGRGVSADFWTQQFDRRSLFLADGFTLGSNESDTYLQITSWTTGYIVGDWYSRQFGKVGTFQVVKKKGFVPLPASATVIESVTSPDTRGPLERSTDGKEYWGLDLQVPQQPRIQDRATLLFQGNYRLHAGGVAWPTRKVLRGSYDFYSGAIGWLIADQGGGEAKIVSGFIDGDKGMKLFWPNDRSWAVGVFDHAWETYRKTH